MELFKGMIGGVLATVIGGLILLAIVRPFSGNGGDSIPQETPLVAATAPVPSGFSFHSPKLHFYASEQEIPVAERRYQTRFSKDSLAYLNWELNISYTKKEGRIPFSIMAVYSHSDGSEFARQTLETYVDKGWSNSYHNWGWGWDKPGEWPKDTFTVALYIQGNMVKQGKFEVY